MTSGKTLSTVSLVVGLVSLVTAALSIFFPVKMGWLCFVALVTGIVAVVLSSKAKKACITAGEPTGSATAGFVCGLLGLIFGALGCILWIACAIVCAAAEEAVGSIPSDEWKELEDALNNIAKFRF